MSVPKYKQIGPSGTAATGTAAVATPPPNYVNPGGDVSEWTSGTGVFVEPKAAQSDESAGGFSFSDMLTATFKSLGDYLFERYTHATLSRAVYAPVNNDLMGYISDTLDCPTVNRLVVDQNNGLWVDEYPFPDGKTYVAFVGTTMTVQLLQYTSPGMIPLVNPGLSANVDPTARIWKGLAPLAETYAAWFRSHYGVAINDNTGRFTLSGHSMGAVGAMLSAYYANGFALPNPPDPSDTGPVARVITFGMPAAFGFTGDNLGLVGGAVSGKSMLMNYGHVRVSQPADYVVWLPTQAASTIKANPFQQGILQAMPTHFQTVDASVADYVSGARQKAIGDWYAKYQLAAFAGNLKAAKDSYDAIIREFGATVDGHAIKTYCGQLERACRATGACPDPGFTRMVTINRWLGDLGF